MNPKNSRGVVLAFLTTMLLLLPGSNSMAKSSKSLTLYQKVQLNEVILEPGDYKVEILENGGAVEVGIYKGKSLVVKAPAKPVQQDKKNQRSSILYLLNGEDAPRMTELRLIGDLVAYQFDSAGQLTKKKLSKNT
jgi:hypothetical protein